MFRSALPTTAPPGQYPEIGPLLATELAIEYQALRAPSNCPAGIYVIPSPETLLVWAGIFFVHKGPYGGAVLRFTITFPMTFPRQRPAVHFESDVLHPMIDPKTREWTPRDHARWHPRVDRVVHLLHAIKASFKTAGLDLVTEEEAKNREVWSLYRHSRPTFLTLTAQRARLSATTSALYGEELSGVKGAPTSPPISTPGIDRLLDRPPSYTSALSSPSTIISSAPTSTASTTAGSSSSRSPPQDGPIHFKMLDDAQVALLWGNLRRSLAEK